jgi:hypothetical protein
VTTCLLGSGAVACGGGDPAGPDADSAPLQDIPLTATITAVQPMTGIVLWEDNGDPVKTQAGVIQLEYAYVGPDTISTAEGTYDWDAFEAMLDRIAGRGHQAIVRFYDTYPGEPTAVPAWIKAHPDYQETSGESEGEPTDFPDWSSPVLEQFWLDFYTEVASRYDDDPRLAFLQVGFGLWGEYHIYDGPNELGQQFPTKAYQRTFFAHLDDAFRTLRWSVSIDAGANYYGPFGGSPELKELGFGLFDDSFMIEEHDGYNAEMWDVFGHEQRILRAPAGGELSYASTYDQRHALDEAGMYGRTFEELSAEYGISYMIGNDQPEYQSGARIRAAGLGTGYRFEITRFAASAARSEVDVRNAGIAPIYYDAFVTVDGERATASLRGLAPGATATFDVPRGGAAPTLTIECDRLVDGQVIGFDAALP